MGEACSDKRRAMNVCRAMAAYVVAVLLGLGLNLWFMAGQVFTLDFLAKWEPTSCVMEWLHDTIFGAAALPPVPQGAA